MTSRVTFVRHARVAANDDRIIGGTDVDAAFCAEIPIATTRPSTVFTSPLKRAWATASARYPDAELIVTDLLTERRLGTWEGMSRKALRLQHPDAFLANGTVHPSFVPPGGESCVVFADRVGRFLRVCAGRPEADQIVAVTHHGVVRAAMALARGLPLKVAFGLQVGHLEEVEVALDAAMDHATGIGADR